MFNLRIKQALLVVAALMALSIPLFNDEMLQAVFLSPLPPGTTPCVSISSGDYVVNVFGYVNHTDGTTTITFSVKNNGKKDVSHLAFSTLNWTRIEPSNGITYTAGLGNYTAVWTENSGNPGFPSIKYTPLFGGYSKGKQDTFALTISGFDPNARLKVQIKAGTNVATVTFTLANPACNFTPTPTPTATATPTDTPTATETPTATPTATPFDSPLPTPKPLPTFPSEDTYVLDDTAFAIPLSEAEKQELWAQGLPVPVTLHESLPISQSVAPQRWGLAAPALLAAPMLQSSTAITVNNWDEDYYTTDFENDFMSDGGNCAWQRIAQAGQSYQWGHDNDRQQSGTYALWPAGYPTSPGSQYVNDMESKLVCRLSNMQDQENVLAAFKLWFKLADAGDSLALFFSTDGVNYKGLQWSGVAGKVVFRDWTDFRIFYPGLANNNNVYILWKFISDGSGVAEGPWVDDLRVERYNKPEGVNCAQKNPTLRVPGVPGNTPVSRGLHLPPYLEDNLGRRMQRLVDAGVQWVRLEFIATPNDLSTVRANTVTPSDYINRVDLKYYDQLIDSLCANNIAVLGLVDNQTLLDQSWKEPQSVSEAYLAAFTGVVEQLVDYYADRIGYWEVWNEPDHEDRRLLAPEYVKLLIATYDKIKATNAGDQVLFGGLGGADHTADSYLRDVYLALTSQGRVDPSPYDVFALHPYPSVEYKAGTGEYLLNPWDYI